MISSCCARFTGVTAPPLRKDKPHPHCFLIFRHYKTYSRFQPGSRMKGQVVLRRCNGLFVSVCFYLKVQKKQQPNDFSLFTLSKLSYLSSIFSPCCLSRILFFRSAQPGPSVHVARQPWRYLFSSSPFSVSFIYLFSAGLGITVKLLMTMCFLYLNLMQ